MRVGSPQVREQGCHIEYIEQKLKMKNTHVFYPLSFFLSFLVVSGGMREVGEQGAGWAGGRSWPSLWVQEWGSGHGCRVLGAFIRYRQKE
jgi:hypothetical protein